MEQIMAKKTIVQLTDDLDGGKADKTVSFSIDHVNYEIDLSQKNVAALEKAFSKYVSAARRVSGRAAAGRGRTTRTNVSADPRAVRAWAASNGIEVSARGRIPADVVKQFEAANAA
jgi:hypothetical protein